MVSIQPSYDKIGDGLLCLFAVALLTLNPIIQCP